MGVVREISRRVRVLGAALAVEGFLKEVGRSSSFVLERSFVRDGRVLSRSCWMSLRDNERPVPS